MRERVSRDSRAMPQAQLSRWLAVARNKGWKLAAKDVVGLIRSRKQFLCDMKEWPQLHRGNLAWVRGSDTAHLPINIINNLIDSYQTVRAVEVLPGLICRSDVSTEEFEAIATRALPDEIEGSAAVLFKAWAVCDARTNEKIRIIAERMGSGTLERVCRECQHDHVKSCALSLLHERNRLLIQAESPEFTGFPRMHWLRSRDVARVGPNGIANTIKANPRCISPVTVLLMILARECDESERVSEVYSSMADSDRVYLAQRATQGLVKLWKHPAQYPTFQALFRSALLAPRVFSMCHGYASLPCDAQAKENRKLIENMSMSAASVPHPVQLVTMMLEAGYPFKNSKNTTVVDIMATARKKRDSETTEAVADPECKSALALLARIAPERVRGAIVNGHRISAAEYRDIRGKIPDRPKELLRRAVVPMRWNPSTHQLFPQKEQERIATTMEAAGASRLPKLPIEMWRIIFGFVYPSRGAIAVGWA